MNRHLSGRAIVVKILFNQRLIRLLNNDSSFIPDMYRILQTYKTGMFPAKIAWKSTENQSVIYIAEKRSRFNSLLDTFIVQYRSMG